MKVLCIGQAVLDCITRNIDESSLKERSARAESIRLSAGGDALNESIIFSRLGNKTSLACITGEDDAGGLIRQILERNGVDTSLMLRRDDVDTVIADILVKADGSRRSINSKAISLNGYHLSPEIAHGYDVLTLASLFRAPLDDADNVRDIVYEAKKEGCLVFADTKVPVYTGVRLQDYEDVLPHLDGIFPNETEASYFTGIDPKTDEDYFRMAEVFLNKSVKRVIIKAGGRGAYYLDQQQRIHQEALQTEIVDTTGAGDNFVAGFITAFFEGKDIRSCLRFASACAALSLTCSGATGGVQNRKQVEGYIKKDS